MDWNKWSDFFEHQWGCLFNNHRSINTHLRLEDHHLDWGCALCELEDATLEEVEAAIRKFAKTKKWPKMSPIAGSLMKERISCASSMITETQWYAKQLKMGPPTRKMSEEKLICWFLIDIWEETGFENLMNGIRAVPVRDTPAMLALKAQFKFGPDLPHPAN